MIKIKSKNYYGRVTAGQYIDVYKISRAKRRDFYLSVLLTALDIISVAVVAICIVINFRK